MGKNFFEKPGVTKKIIGDFVFEIHLAEAKNLPKTSYAMERVAKAEIRDDKEKRRGNNDYSMSLEKLLGAFDTFIRESSNGKYSAGSKKNYNIFNRYELTILLLWQIRHVLTHQGGAIDKKCKEDYEEIFSEALKNDVKPIIDLPKTLEIDEVFTIDFDNYFKFNKCIFRYINKRIPKKDAKILHKRACFTDIKFGGPEVIINSDYGELAVNIEEALNSGCKFDLSTLSIQFPSQFKYDEKNEKIILISSGESFSAKRVKERRRGKKR